MGQNKVIQKLLQSLPIFGAFLFFLGLISIYLALYGRNIFYTQTYHYVSQILRPAFNAELLFASVCSIISLLLVAVSPLAKANSIDFISKRAKLSITFILVGSLGTSIALALFVRGIGVDELSSLIAMVLIGGVGLFFTMIALYPKSLKPFIRSASWKIRLSSLFIAAILTILSVSAIELTISGKVVEQTLQSQTVVDPTHSISAILGRTPARLKPGDSIPINMRFRLTDYDPNSSLRYPIRLKSTHDYGVSVSIQSTGFEISEALGGIESTQAVEVDQLIEWTWIIQPQESSLGTSQLVAFDIILHDLTEEDIKLRTPATTLKLEVGTPLGLPTWLVSPQVGIGAIIGGLGAIILPWLLNEISAKRNK